MTSASDKSRFYLEKLVPELREYERKKIFSKVSTLVETDPDSIFFEIHLALT